MFLFKKTLLSTSCEPGGTSLGVKYYFFCGQGRLGRSCDMKRRFLILCILASVGTARAEPNAMQPTAPAPASLTSPSPFALVQYFIARQQWQAARIALQDVANDPAADPIEVLFLGGMIAIGNEDYASAIKQFQKILIDHPSIPRVRLELARAYFLAGDWAGAKYHFERVLASDLPAPVVANVEHYLEQIRMQRGYNFGFNFALLPDSNINQAPSAQTIIIAGLPMVLNSDARETSGIGVLWRLGGDRWWQMSDQWRFTTGGSLLRKDYSKHQFNDMILYARLGPRYLFEGGDTGFGVSLGKRLIGDHPYSNANGLYVDSNYQITDHWWSYASLESQKYRFVVGKGEPGTLTTASGKLRYMLSPSSLVEGGLDLSRDTTISEIMRHNTVGVFLGYRSEAPFGLLYGVNLYASRSPYPVFQGFFDAFRKDELTSFTVDVTKRDWKIFDLSPTVSVTVIHNNSTIPFFTYRRTLGQFGFTRQF